MLLLAPVTLAAQDSTAVGVPPATTAAPDTLAPPPTGGPMPTVRDTTSPFRRVPISPGKALVRSLLIPGWGQLRLRRPVVGAVFAAAEVTFLAFAIQADRQARSRERAGDGAGARDAYSRREDFLIYLGLNHVLSGIEAFVTAHLFDFPADLDLQVAPGMVGARVTVPVRVP